MEPRAAILANVPLQASSVQPMQGGDGPKEWPLRLAPLQDGMDTPEDERTS